MWPFSKKEEVRAETNPDTGQIVASDPLLQALLGENTVTRADALQIPAIQSCIGMLSGAIESLPIKLYERKEDSVSEVENDHRIRLLNDDTGDTLTAAQFWRAMLEDYYFGKGGFAYLNRRGGNIDSIHYVDEAQVSIIKNTDPIFKQYDIYVQGEKHHPFEFFKILRKTKDGMTSIPLQDECPLIVSVAHSSLVYEQNMVKKGGNKRGFLKSSKKLSRDVMDQLKAAFRNLYSNNSTENVVVLNDGIDFKESSNTSVEMQLNENKKVNSAEICEIFGFSSRLLEGGATDKDYDRFIQAVMKLVNDIECSLDRDLLLESEKGNKYFAFDTRELTRGNLKERYEAYKIGLEKNFLQIDEVRKIEDMEPIGFDWITLGLDQVLFNPKTGMMYTPNTNAVQNMEFTELPNPEKPAAEPDDEDIEDPEEPSDVEDDSDDVPEGTSPEGGTSKSHGKEAEKA